MPEFLAGPEHELAAAALLPLLSELSAANSPLSLCGPSGAGKSHLALGLATHWKRRLPAGSLAVTTAGDFIEEHAEAAQTRTMADLRRKYREAQLLVFENLHHFAEKKGWKSEEAQQELARTLDERADAETLTVCTCRVPPQCLAGLNPRLRGRLAAGLVAPLPMPAAGTRAALLARLAQDRGIEFDESSLQRLAEGIRGPAPALAECLSRLEMGARGRPLDADGVQAFLERERKARTPSLSEIAAAAARQFGVRVEELRGARRARTIVLARHVAMFMARELTGASLAEIGRYFGRRDHTTVLHSLRKITAIQQDDSATGTALRELREKFAW